MVRSSQWFNCQETFETEVAARVTKIKLIGQTPHFLGIKFQWICHADGHLACKLSQEAFTDNLVEIAELCSNFITYPLTLYRSGLPIDSITNNPPEDPTKYELLETKCRSIAGSLNWVALSTCPDLDTVTNLLAQH
eukprot:15356134-Ditylum_brightwellii.AAC.1